MAGFFLPKGAIFRGSVVVERGFQPEPVRKDSRVDAVIAGNSVGGEALLGALSSAGFGCSDLWCPSFVGACCSLPTQEVGGRVGVRPAGKGFRTGRVELESLCGGEISCIAFERARRAEWMEGEGGSSNSRRLVSSTEEGPWIGVGRDVDGDRGKSPVDRRDGRVFIGRRRLVDRDPRDGGA